MLHVFDALQLLRSIFAPALRPVETASWRNCLNQWLWPYVISGHPGVTFANSQFPGMKKQVREWILWLWPRISSARILYWLSHRSYLHYTDVAILDKSKRIPAHRSRSISPPKSNGLFPVRTSPALPEISQIQFIHSFLSNTAQTQADRQTQRQADQTRHTVTYKHNLLMASGAHSHSYKLNSPHTKQTSTKANQRFSLLRFTHCNILHVHNSASSDYC